MNLEQLKAILWLRWRLTRNQFYRSGSIGTVLSIVTLVALASVTLSLAAGAFIGGLAAGRQAGPDALMIICDAGFGMFLLFWMVGLVTEIQRAETLEIGKLLHLPISPRQLYVINYAASHASPGLILFIPAVVCFCIGLTLTSGMRMLLLLPVCFAFLLALTSWTYCLRGWLAGLMSNRRRARSIAVWLTLAMVLIGQAPNLIMQMQRGSPRERGKRARQMAEPGQQRQKGIPEGVVLAHMYVPPGWPGFAARTLKEGRFAAAFSLTAAGALLVVAGILRGDRMTLRFYQGGGGGTGAVAAKRAVEEKNQSAGVGRPPKPSMMLWRIPFVGDDTAGLALATFKSLLRAPEVKMALLMPIIMFVVFSVAGRGKLPSNLWAAPLLLTGAVLFACFSVAPTMCNAFGLDRSGFRTLLLSPIRRRDMLLAKNLGFLPFYAVLCLLVIAGGAFVLKVGVDSLFTALLQSLAGYLLFSIVANLFSILAPYHLSMNSMRAKTFKPLMLVSGFGFMVAASLIGGVLGLAPLAQIAWERFGPGFYLPLNIIIGAGLLTLSAVLYGAVLPSMGGLLHKRELTMLKEITSESE